jgi:methyl-galactoside transport system substrate-binding protein
MKKNKLAILFPLLSLLLGSCSANSLRISAFFYDENDTFIKELRGYLKQGLENGNYNYDFYFAQKSQATQNTQITAEIESKKNSLLLINSVDRLADSTLIQKAKNYDLPIIFFNREPLDSDLANETKFFYVGSNPQTEGLLQAEMAASLFGDPHNLNPKYDKNGDQKIEIVLLKGEQGHQDMENRSKFCIQGLKDKGYTLDILTTEFCNWSRTQAYETMSTIYPTYGESIELLFSNNDDMALGAIDYFKDKEIFKTSVNDVTEQPFPVIGVDGTTVALDAIKNHLLYGTIKNDSYQQASAILTLANYIVGNKTIDGTFPFKFAGNNKIYIEGKTIIYSDL